MKYFASFLTVFSIARWYSRALNKNDLLLFKMSLNTNLISTWGVVMLAKKERTSPIPSQTCQRVMFWMWMMNGNESIAFGKLHIKIIEDC